MADNKFDNQVSTLKKIIGDDKSTGAASKSSESAATNKASRYLKLLDDDTAAKATDLMATKLATNGTGSASGHQIQKAKNFQKQALDSDRDTTYTDDNAFSAVSELVDPSSGNTHSTGRRIGNVINQIANAPGQAIGEALNGAFDTVVGGLGDLTGWYDGDAARDLFDADDAAIVGDIATDVALGALGPVGWAAMAGKNVAQHANDIGDMIAGDDYYTGEDLDASNYIGKLGSIALDAGVPLKVGKVVGKGAGKAAKEATKGIEKAGKKAAKKEIKGKSNASAKAIDELGQDAVKGIDKETLKAIQDEVSISRAAKGKGLKGAAKKLEQQMSGKKGADATQLTKGEREQLVKAGKLEDGLLDRISPELKEYKRNNAEKGVMHALDNLKENLLLGSASITANSLDNGVNPLDAVSQMSPAIAASMLMGRARTPSKYKGKSVSKALGNKLTRGEPAAIINKKGKVIDTSAKAAQNVQRALTNDAIGRLGELYSLEPDYDNSVDNELNDIFDTYYYGEEA